MAFQNSSWGTETKTAPTNAQEIERTRQAKQDSRKREVDRVADYRRQQQQQQQNQQD